MKRKPVANVGDATDVTVIRTAILKLNRLRSFLEPSLEHMLSVLLSLSLFSSFAFGASCFLEGLEGQESPEGDCYVQVTTSRLSWTESRSTCKSWHSAADLPVIQDALTASFVFSLFTFSEMWLGANNLLDEERQWTEYGSYGIWRWNDGSLVADSFSVWASHYEPSNSDRRCMEMIAGGVWDSDSCDDYNPFLCVVLAADVNRTTGGSLQVERNVRLLEVDVATHGDNPFETFCNVDEFLCPSRFWCNMINDTRLGCHDNGTCHFDPTVRLPYCECDSGFGGMDCLLPGCSVLGKQGVLVENTCYFEFTRMTLSWSEARETCKAWHSAADLPDIRNSAIQIGILGMFSTIDEAERWTGGANLKEPSTWRWRDRTSLDEGMNFWDVNQPSYSVLEGCVAMRPPIGYPSGTDNALAFFNDECTERKQFICAVDMDEIAWVTNGSRIDFKNMRYDQYHQNNRYCDFDQFICPNETFCYENPDRRAACSENGLCTLDHSTKTFACLCDAGFFGDSCDLPGCNLAGEVGFKTASGSCIVQVTEDEEPFYYARKRCKEWHSAADLVIPTTAALNDVLIERFGSQLWLGIQKLQWLEPKSNPTPWRFIDGVAFDRASYDWTGWYWPSENYTSDYCAYIQSKYRYWYGPASCSTYRPFVCEVATEDFGRVLNGSVNEKKNTLFQYSGDAALECDIDQYEFCPEITYCGGTSDLRAGCNHHGTCHYDPIMRDPYCECDVGYNHDYCTATECEINGKSGWELDGICVVEVSAGFSSWGDARDTCKAWHPASDLPDKIFPRSLMYDVARMSSGRLWAGFPPTPTKDGTYHHGFFNNEPLTGSYSSSTRCFAWMGSSGWNPDDRSCTELNRFVCAIDVRDVNGTNSSYRPWINVVFDGLPYSSSSYCNIDVDLCPDPYWCDGMSGALTCEGHGQCSFDEYREDTYCHPPCAHGWKGEDCSYDICGACNEDHSECNGTQCLCHGAWTGEFCYQDACGGCGSGYCSPETISCVCEGAWTSTHCDQLSAGVIGGLAGGISGGLILFCIILIIVALVYRKFGRDAKTVHTNNVKLRKTNL